MPSFHIPNRLDVGILPIGVEGLNGAESITQGLAGTQLLVGPQSLRRSLGGNPQTFTQVKVGGDEAGGYGFVGTGTERFLLGSAVTVPALPLTMAAWVIPGTFAGSNGYAISQGEEVAFGAQIALRLVAGGTDDVGYVVRTTTSGTIVTISGGTAVLGVPCLIVGRSISESDHVVYFNGRAVNFSTTNVGTASGEWQNTVVGALRVNTNTNYFNGRVLQWAIWNRALKLEEIVTLYTDPWRMYWIPGRTVYFDTAPVVTTARSYGYIFG
jgi:hypothetical protein